MPTHYSFIAELLSKPAVIGLRNFTSFLKKENTLYNPEMRNIKGTEKKSDMVPWYDITEEENQE